MFDHAAVHLALYVLMSWSQTDEWLARGAVLAGLVGFIFGLYQYREAQRWKRAEFVASEIDRFAAMPATERVMQLLDWTTVELDFGGDVGKNWITDELLTSALDAHGDRPAGGFSALEKCLRETFDDFLDQLERFQNFVDAGLVRKSEFRPYLDYWVDLIALPGGRRSPAFRTALFAYLDEYDFNNAKRLILTLTKAERSTG